MKKSFTFLIKYETFFYKIKVFNKGSVQLNGVKTTDWTYIENIVKFIKENILLDKSGDLNFNILMSNYKITFYFSDLVNNVYKPIVKLKEVKNIFSTLNTIFSNFVYEYD